MATLPKVLIFGHSFIDRLQGSIRNCQDSVLLDNFGLRQCEVTLAGFGGLCISKNLERFNRAHSVLLPDCDYDIAIVQIGSNDITPDSSPVDLARKILDFATYLVQTKQIKIVYTCQIFQRQQPRYMRPEVFEVIRTSTNNHIEQVLKAHTHIRYWAHKRIFHSPLQVFLRDGVHLNAAGTKKFYKSLRQAIIFAVEDFKSFNI